MRGGHLERGVDAVTTRRGSALHDSDQAGCGRHRSTLAAHARAVAVRLLHLIEERGRGAVVRRTAQLDRGASAGQQHLQVRRVGTSQTALLQLPADRGYGGRTVAQLKHLARFDLVVPRNRRVECGQSVDQHQGDGEADEPRRERTPVESEPSLLDRYPVPWRLVRTYCHRPLRSSPRDERDRTADRVPLTRRRVAITVRAASPAHLRSSNVTAAPGESAPVRNFFRNPVSGC